MRFAPLVIAQIDDLLTKHISVWQSHFKVHKSKEKGYAAKAGACDYCHKPLHSTLSRHIEWHHKDQLKNDALYSS